MIDVYRPGHGFQWAKSEKLPGAKSSQKSWWNIWISSPTFRSHIIVIYQREFIIYSTIVYDCLKTSQKTKKNKPGRFGFHHRPKKMSFRSKNLKVDGFFRHPQNMNSSRWSHWWFKMKKNGPVHQFRATLMYYFSRFDPILPYGIESEPDLRYWTGPNQWTFMKTYRRFSMH